MKKTVLVSALLNFVFGLALARLHAADFSAADEIRQLEQTWANAMVASQHDVLVHLLAPEFTQVTVRRASITTASQSVWLENIQHMAFQTCSPQVISVEAIGDTAIATVDLTWTVAMGGQAGAVDYFYLTDVWIKRAGQWQAVRRHSSPYPKANVSTPGHHN